MHHHTLGTCIYCRKQLTPYDLDRGPGQDGECAKCGRESEPEESPSERLNRQLSQSGQLGPRRVRA